MRYLDSALLRSTVVFELSFTSPFLIERYSSFFYPLLILTMDTTLFCFAKQWPMTRASSIKDFHKFATLTVTIPLEVDNFYEISRLRFAPLDIRDIRERSF